MSDQTIKAKNKTAIIHLEEVKTLETYWSQIREGNIQLVIDNIWHHVDMDQYLRIVDSSEGNRETDQPGVS